MTTTASGQLPDDDPAISRRDALVQLAGTGLCACCALVAGCPADRPEQADQTESVTKPIHASAPQGLQPLLSLDRLDINEPTPWDIGKKPVYLLRGQDARLQEYLYIFDGHCPHARCKYAWQSAPTNMFVCPCHGSRFTIDGLRVAGPARRGLRRIYYELRERVIYADYSRNME